MRMEKARRKGCTELRKQLALQAPGRCPHRHGRCKGGSRLSAARNQDGERGRGVLWPRAAAWFGFSWTTIEPEATSSSNSNSANRTRTGPSEDWFKQTRPIRPINLGMSWFRKAHWKVQMKINFLFFPFCPYVVKFPTLSLSLQRKPNMKVP